MKFPILALASTAIALTIAACSAPTAYRDEVAMRLASPAWMNKRTIDTGDFTLTTFERMHTKNASVTVYIEGDGTATRGASIKSPADPTPNNPVALHLATRDKADNVAYVARPCQYAHMAHYDHNKPHEETECTAEYWGDKRFNDDVINAYNTALDNIQNQYSTKDFHLVGYDGGGAIAAILAAKRDDVLSLRTVAGNLDHNAQSVYLGLPPLSESLNAIDFAADLRDMPQHHFIGGQDEIIKPAVFNSYLQAIGDTKCVKHTLIQEAEHDKGWVEKWPTLLKTEMPVCEKAAAPAFEPLDTPEPIFVPRMSGDKK